MANRALRFALHSMRGTLKDHSATVPLLGACFFSGSMGIFTMLYTSLRKSDVSYNRWSSSQAYQPLKVTSDEKLYVAKSSQEAYNYDTRALQGLLDEIYEDGRYMTKY